MPKKVLILPGDGVGKEITDAATSVLEAVTGDAEILHGRIGASAYEKTGYYLPPETMELAAKSDAIIATPVLNRAIEKNYRDPLATLRKQLDMSSVLRKFQPLGDGIGVSGLDCMLINCNPQTVGTSKEVETLNGVSVEYYIDAGGCRKVFRMGERIATAKQRRKITCLRDLELNPYSDAMFADLFYKEFAASEFIIDDMDVADATSKLIMDLRSPMLSSRPCRTATPFPGLSRACAAELYLTCVGYLSARPAGCSCPCTDRRTPCRDRHRESHRLHAGGGEGAGRCRSQPGGRQDTLTPYVRRTGRAMNTRDVGWDHSTSEFTYRVTKLCKRSR